MSWTIIFFLLSLPPSTSWLLSSVDCAPPSHPIYYMLHPRRYCTGYAHISTCRYTTSMHPLYPHLLIVTLCITAPSVHAFRPSYMCTTMPHYTCLSSISTGRYSALYCRLNFLSNQVAFLLLAHECYLQILL